MFAARGMIFPEFGFRPEKTGDTVTRSSKTGGRIEHSSYKTVVVSTGRWGFFLFKAVVYEASGPISNLGRDSATYWASFAPFWVLGKSNVQFTNRTSCRVTGLPK